MSSINKRMSNNFLKLSLGILIAICIILFVMFLAFCMYFQKADYKGVYSKLEKYFDGENSVVTILQSKDKLILNFYNHDNKWDRSDRNEIAFTPQPGEYSIYIFGASELLNSLKIAGKEYMAFPSVLERQIKTNNCGNKAIYNFGMRYFDTYNVKKMIKESIKIRKPGLIICNSCPSTDFTKAYMTVVKPELFLFTRILTVKPIIPKFFNFALKSFFSLYFEPNAMELGQRLGLIKIDWGEVVRWDELIFSRYKDNVREIMKMAADNNIPLVLIVPVFNLEERPYGKYPEALDYYYRGLRQKDYIKRMEYLFKASDLGSFSFFVNRKDEASAFLRSLKGSGVYIFDLEKELMEEKFEFGHKNFYDQVHLKKNAQRLIGQKLYLFLKNSGILLN